VVLIGRDSGTAVNSTDVNGLVAIGRRSATAITSGQENVAIGYQSLMETTTGDYNTAVGHNSMSQDAGLANTNNTFMGRNSGGGNWTTGACSHNTGIGANSMAGAMNGALNNTAVGSHSLEALTTGDYNVAIGAYALDEIVTGGYNVAIGHNALGNLDAGENENVAIGNNAGLNLDGGINNVLIGANVNGSAGNANGQIVIGKDVTGSAGNSTATLGLSSNKVSISLDGSDTSWAASSDERLKENIQTSTAGLSFINELRPVTFNWKKAKDVDNSMSQYQDSEEPVLGAEGSYGKTMHGFIAQEVKSTIDKHSDLKEGFGMWQEWEDGTQAVSDGALVPMLVKAVQELSARVEELEGK
jgi:hypothetical protein